MESYQSDTIYDTCTEGWLYNIKINHMDDKIPLNMLKTLTAGNLVVGNGVHTLYYGNLTDMIDVI